jgi:hypothetical protein
MSETKKAPAPAPSHMTPYAATDGAQRRKIFKLLAQHTSVLWGSGGKLSPNDLQKIKRNLYMSYTQATGLVFSTAKPQTPRCETKTQDILRSIRADYPVVISVDEAKDKLQVCRTAASKGKAKPRTPKQRRIADNAQQGRLL